MGRHVSAEEFRHAREDYGSRREAAKVCGVTDRQVRRWETGQSPAPRAAYRLLRLLAGDLGEIAPLWEGWRITAEAIVPPGAKPGQAITPGWWWYRRPHQLYRRDDRERELRAKIERLFDIIDALIAGREENDNADQLDLFPRAEVIELSAVRERIRLEKSARHPLADLGKPIPTPRGRAMSEESRAALLAAWTGILESDDPKTLRKLTPELRADIALRRDALAAIDLQDIRLCVEAGFLAPARESAVCMPRIPLRAPNGKFRRGAPCYGTPVFGRRAEAWEEPPDRERA